MFEQFLPQLPPQPNGLPPRRRIVRYAIHTIICFVACCMPYAGRTTDSVCVGSRDVYLTERWRVNSSDPDILFGLIGSACRGQRGEIYLLDVQLKRILVIDGDGSLIRTLGREGQGPGELRSPAGLLTVGGGDLIIVDHWPARIERISSEGVPVATFDPRRNLDDYAVYNLHKADSGGDVVGCMLSHSMNGLVSRAFELVTLDARGVIVTTYGRWELPVSSERDFIDESAGFIPAHTWCLFDDGTMAFAPLRDEYVIEFYDQQGGTVRTLRRAYESPPRTAADLDRIRRMHRKFVNGQEVELRFRLMTYDPVILALDALDDGSLWVFTSRSYRNLPDGAALQYDVYDPRAGTWEATTLYFPNRVECDVCYLLGDGSILQVRNYSDMNLAAIAVGTDDSLGCDPDWEIVYWTIDHARHTRGPH